MATAPHAVDAATLLTSDQQATQRESKLVRVLHLWHLLSLDAPTVAMLWTMFLARASHIAVPVTSVLAMGTAVWMLYAADRLLDTRFIRPKAATSSGKVSQRTSFELVAPQFNELEPRHYFHYDHEKAFRFGILAASIALAILLPQLAPESIRLYLVLGTTLFGYFILIHLKSANTYRLPKELAVGVFFSAAVFIPTVARDPGLRLALLPGAMLFAVVCSLNCLFIYAWEHPGASPQTDPATDVALRLLPHLAAGVAIGGLILSIAGRGLPWTIPIACGTAAVLLLLLHQNRQRFTPTTLRAAADLCLLTPLLLLPLIPR